jgi:copper chaperone CopZ
MPEPRQTVLIDRHLCRRCVRAVSRRLRDLPGVRSFVVDVAEGRVTVVGDIDRAALEAAVGAPGCAQGPGAS